VALKREETFSLAPKGEEPGFISGLRVKEDEIRKGKSP